MKTEDLKLILKGIIKEIQSVNEISYDVDNEVDRDSDPYGGWLDPNGKFHAVNYEGHIVYANKILDKLGINYKDAYAELYRLGFIRVVFGGTTLYYRYKAWDQKFDPPNQRKMKALKDLAIECRCDRLVDCDTNQAITDFQESILTEQNLVGLKFWWMDTDYKFHPVAFEQHRYWAEAYLKRIGYGDVKDVYNAMFKLGFVRVVKQQYNNELILGFQYTRERPLNSKQLKVIKDLAIEEGCEYLVDDTTHRETRLTESYKYEENEYSNTDWAAWWLDPNGKFHDVYNPSPNRSGHWNWAKNYLISHKKPFDRLDSPVEVLRNMGWIRVTFNYYKDGVLHFDALNKSKLTNLMMRSLKDHAIEIHASALVDDNTRKPVELNETTLEKEKQVKQFLSQMNDDTMVVTVSREDEYPEASYVQVDGFWNGDNVFSSNPEELNQWGFKIPSSSQFLTLPRGQYKLKDAKSKLKMSLKEVRQLFSPDGERRWWMDTNGRIYDVSKEGHSAWGAKYITDKFGEDNPASQYANSDFHAPYQILFGAGWIRMLFMSANKILAYEYDEREPNSKQMSNIKRLAKDLKAVSLYNERTNRTEPLEENLSEDMSYDELLKLTTPERKDRAANVTARSLPVSTENGLETWNFRYKSSPQTTVTDKPFRGSISFIKGKVGQNNNAMKMKCKVDCECPDFMYRFAYNDAAKGASQVGPDSLNGALNRRPKPAYDYGEGLCKHLTALGRFLKTKIQSTKKSNLFEAIDEVTNQGPFNVTYYD